LANKIQFSLNIEGAKAKMVEYLEAVRQMAAQELRELAEEIKTESQANYCPVLTGNLRASAFVRQEGEVSYRDPHQGRDQQGRFLAKQTIKGGGNPLAVQIGYGGPAASYALKVHENPNAGKAGYSGQKGHSAVGEWKYLETPFKAMAPQLPSRLGAGLKRIKVK
jgi:hypothetical protein